MAVQSIGGEVDYENWRPENWLKLTDWVNTGAKRLKGMDTSALVEIGADVIVAAIIARMKKMGMAPELFFEDVLDGELQFAIVKHTRAEFETAFADEVAK